MPDDHRAPRADDAPPREAPPPSPMGEAFTWVARITAVGLGMALPAVAGTWLDTRLGTTFLGPAGVVVGLAVALAWVVRLGATAPARPRRRGRRPGPDTVRESPGDGGPSR
jgi:hypothetical protein